MHTTYSTIKVKRTFARNYGKVFKIELDESVINRLYRNTVVFFTIVVFYTVVFLYSQFITDSSSSILNIYTYVFKIYTNILVVTNTNVFWEYSIMNIYLLKVI